MFRIIKEYQKIVVKCHIITVIIIKNTKRTVSDQSWDSRKKKPDMSFRINSHVNLPFEYNCDYKIIHNSGLWDWHAILQLHLGNVQGKVLWACNIPLVLKGKSQFLYLIHDYISEKYVIIFCMYCDFYVVTYFSIFEIYTWELACHYWYVQPKTRFWF